MDLGEDPNSPGGGARSGDPRPRPGLIPSSDFLKARCASLARQYGVPGAQLALYERGRTVTVEVGELDQCGARVTVDSAFPIGSITKVFTATLAMTLVADGDLDLDTPVGEYAADLGHLDGITLRHLLSHTAGLDGGPDGSEVATLSARRYLARYGRRTVLPPGRAFSYSNTGYILVGALVEAVCGMSWAEAVESIVLRPLGIEPTLVCGHSAVVRHSAVGRPVAVGHASSGGRPRPVRQTLAPVQAPAGALATSAADLVRLGVALVDGKRTGAPAVGRADALPGAGGGTVRPRRRLGARARQLRLRVVRA
jgi:CubicO group peptidase (beta-lactamase class C family)